MIPLNFIFQQKVNLNNEKMHITLSNRLGESTSGVALYWNLTGVGISNMGQLNSQYASQLNIEVTKMEREITKYFENASNHTKLYFTSSKLNVILNGLFVLLISIAFSFLSL